MKPQHVELHIEELVLHGFPHGDRHRVGDAVERELSRLLAEQGVPPSLGHRSEIERLCSDTFEMKLGARAQPIGTQVAQSVYGALGA